MSTYKDLILRDNPCEAYQKAKECPPLDKIDFKVTGKKQHHVAEKRKRKKVLPLKPDFILMKDEKSWAILDAKFKNPINDGAKIAISPQDIYQLVTYAVPYKCEHIYLIYPKFLGGKYNNTLLDKYKRII